MQHHALQLSWQWQRLFFWVVFWLAYPHWTAKHNLEQTSTAAAETVRRK